jgi:hypothetical protein
MTTLTKTQILKKSKSKELSPKSKKILVSLKKFYEKNSVNVKTTALLTSIILSLGGVSLLGYIHGKRFSSKEGALHTITKIATFLEDPVKWLKSFIKK